MKLPVSQLVKKFSAFYGTRRFITAFTSTCHLSLSWARSIQSIPLHHTSWRSILISSSHLRLGLPSGLFPSGFPATTLYTSLLTCYIPRSSHFTWYCHLNTGVQIIKLLVMQSSPLPCYFVPLGPKDLPQDHFLKHIQVSEEWKPIRCHLLFYCTSYRLNMFRALLCPSSGARDYNVDYRIGRSLLGLLWVGG